MGRPRGGSDDRRKVPATDGLTPKQRIAIIALASGKSYIEAAADAGVSDRMLREWRTSPAFQAALDAEVELVIGEARRELRRHARTFVATLVEVAREAESDAARVSAAREGLSRIGISERTEHAVTADVTAKVDATVTVREAVDALGALTPEQLRALAGPLDADDPERDG